jgi:flagellar basal-body rod protein FlgB
MLDRLEASLGFYKQALDLRDRRQDVLATNIANADTPAYKARDFDFRAELDRVLGSTPGTNGTPAVALEATARGHMAANAPGSVEGTQLAYRNAGQPSLDGNTVDMDVERVEFMNNAVHYRANLQILGAQIKSLRAAMQPER